MCHFERACFSFCGWSLDRMLVIIGKTATGFLIKKEKSSCGPQNLILVKSFIVDSVVVTFKMGLMTPVLPALQEGCKDKRIKVGESAWQAIKSHVNFKADIMLLM